MFEMRSLESYKCVDERGRDEGANVRHRVKQILELLADDDLLRQERRKSKHEGKEKYQGFSREEMMYGGGGKGRSSSGNGSNSISSAKKGGFDDWGSAEDGRRSGGFKDGGDNGGGKKAVEGEVQTFNSPKPMETPTLFFRRLALQQLQHLHWRRPARSHCL